MTRTSKKKQTPAKAPPKDSAKQPASRKQLGAKNSQVRATLIEAAERLLLDEGYASLTARRIAAEAGLGHQLIYYYFETLDELLIAVFHLGASKGNEKLEAALQSETPLRALWDIYSDRRMTKFVMELMALANHNRSLRDEVARYWAELRRRQVDVIARHFEKAGVKSMLSPLVVNMLMIAVARLLGNEESLDYFDGHAETKALVEACLAEIERSEAGAAQTLFRRRD